MIFPTDYGAILDRIQKIDPIGYGNTRNYVDGDVTYLSPYISRGVISTKEILGSTLNRGFSPKSIEKFIQELVWREYWQEVWWAKGTLINHDLKSKQDNVRFSGIPNAINDGKTNIKAIDEGLHNLYETGYIHNHIRMYTASVTCNIGQYHWLTPAKWMYYHLLDGDWASNALSWQWVAGTNSNKKYIANQENVNRFCNTNQQKTFLDVDYKTLGNMECPIVFQESIEPVLKTNLPKTSPLKIDSTLPTLIYTSYNLDPNWLNDVTANRILLLEPSHFDQYPISDKVLVFVLNLSKNIPNIQIHVGEFNELIEANNIENVHFKRHPFSTHFKGTAYNYDKIFNVSGYHSSFFRYWNKGKKTVQW